MKEILQASYLRILLKSIITKT